MCTLHVREKATLLTLTAMTAADGAAPSTSADVAAGSTSASVAPSPFALASPPGTGTSTPRAGATAAYGRRPPLPPLRGGGVGGAPPPPLGPKNSGGEKERARGAPALPPTRSSHHHRARSLSAARTPAPAAAWAASTLGRLAAAAGVPPPADPDFDGVRATNRVANAVARGAATGALLRGGLHAASLLLAAAAPSRRARRTAAGAPGLGASLADTLRWAAFLGAYAGTYVAVDECIARSWGRTRTAPWRAAVAGVAAAPAITLTGPKDRHTSLALYVLVRGLTLLVRVGNKPGGDARLRAALAPTRWAHGDTALMCLSTAQVRQNRVRRLQPAAASKALSEPGPKPSLNSHFISIHTHTSLLQIAYSWIFKPHTLPPSFVRFLNKHGGYDAWYYASAKELGERTAAGMPLSLLGDAGAGVPPMKSLALAPPSHVAAVLASGAHPCDWAHPGTTCDGNAARFFPGAYARALPVYLPVYVLPALLVHRKRLLTPGPEAAALWAKVLKGAARSSAFLALYCTLAWRGACAGFTVTGRITPAGIAASAWTGGLATLVEKKSRRMELALYCVSRALESAALCAPEWGLWTPAARHGAPHRRRLFFLPRLDVLIFAAASGCIMHCYSGARGRHRDVFRSKYLEVLDFILGSEGVGAGAIRHAPSTRDLVAAAAAAAGDTGAGAAAGALAGRARSLLGSLTSLAETAVVAAAEAARERAAHGGDDSPVGDADGGLTAFGPAVDGVAGGGGGGVGGGGAPPLLAAEGTPPPASSPPPPPPPIVTFTSPRAWPGAPPRGGAGGSGGAGGGGPHSPHLPPLVSGGPWTTRGISAASASAATAALTTTRPRWRKNGWEARLSGDMSEEEQSPRLGGGGMRPSQWAPRPTAATAALRATADAEKLGRRGGGGGGGPAAAHPSAAGMAGRAQAEASRKERDGRGA